MTLSKTLLRAATAAILVAGLVHAAPAWAQASADVSLTVSTPDNIAYPTTTYTLTVKNLTAATAATGVVLSGTVDSKGTVKSVSNCTPVTAGTPLPCTVQGANGEAAGTLNGGKSSLPMAVVVEYAVPATCPAEDYYGPASFSVATTTTDPVTTNNAVTSALTIMLPLADIEVSLTGPGGLSADGGTYVFNYTVKNNGPCAAPDVYLAVDDSVATGFKWKAATGICGGNDAFTEEPITDDFIYDGGVAVDYTYCLAAALAKDASLSGTKTYTLKAFPSDLISSNQGTGLQLITNGDYTDWNPDNDIADKTYVVTQSAGCSTTGAGNGLVLAGLALGLVLLKRRRSA